MASAITGSASLLHKAISFLSSKYSRDIHLNKEQDIAIKSLLKEKDVLAVLPTGFGKTGTGGGSQIVQRPLQALPFPWCKKLGPKVGELLLVGRGRCAKRLSRAFVGCFDDEVISVFEIYEGSPFFFGEVGEFGVAVRF